MSTGNNYDPQFDVTRQNRAQQTRPAPVLQTQQRVSIRRPGGCASLWMAGLRGMIAIGLFLTIFPLLLAGLYRIAPPPRTNFLILGVDARPDEGMITRSDVMMLATVDPAQLYVGILSIPRDLYVPIPGYYSDRINAAHVLGEQQSTGGGSLLAALTVEQNFQIRVHRTLRLNFEGFIAMIDAAGGVDISVQEYMIDYEYPTADYGVTTVEFQPGLQHMDGQRALQYARTRHGSSDFARARRQQQVIQALIDQLRQIENWGRWPTVVQALADHVTTDATLLDILAMAPTVLWVGADGMDHRVLDDQMTRGFQTSGGASVLEPQWDQINPVLYEMFLR